MIVLNIETSTDSCSAAITIDGVAVAVAANLSAANHASELPVFIEQLLNQAKANNWHLDAVALSQGPGSYTGLRIGASIAKGICYGLNIPLIPIDTLQVLCASLQHTVEEGALLCPMLDARRMEVYTALYEQTDNEGIKPLSHIEAKVIDEHAFAEQLQQQKIVFFGNGAMKCKEVITAQNACFIENIVPQAQYMGPLAEAQTTRLTVKEMAYYEPFYLKEFVAAPSHIKGLK